MSRSLLIVVAVLAAGCHGKTAPAPRPAPSSERAMEWNVPLDPIAITLPEIISGKTEIRLVTHDEGHGGWTRARDDLGTWKG
jgi:hypothetical protein